MQYAYLSSIVFGAVSGTVVNGRLLAVRGPCWPRERPFYSQMSGLDCPVAVAVRDYFDVIILNQRDVLGPAGWRISDLK